MQNPLRGICIRCVGGAPANVCGAYAKLGGKTRLMTQLGKDPFGDKILKEMQASSHSPCQDVPVADTTGAGDGFIGSFLWKLCQAGVDAAGLEGLHESQLYEMVDFSNRFCTISVQSKGAIASYPTLEQMGE